MKRKLILGIIVMFLFAFIMNNKNVYAATDGYYQYNIRNNSYAEIVKYTGNEKEVHIPKELGGYEVKSIGESAFYNNSIIEKIVIPSSVIQINQYAFYNCNNLKMINISNHLTVLGNYAFAYCRNLECLELPKKISNIGLDVLIGCTSMTKVTINGISEGGYYTDQGVLYKTDGKLVYYPASKPDRIYTIKNGTKKIMSGAFDELQYGCTIIFPNSVESLVGFSFANSKQPITFVLNSISKLPTLDCNALYYLATGTKIIVKTNALKSALVENLYNKNKHSNIDNIEICSNYYPAEKIYFTNKKESEIQVSLAPGELYEIPWEISPVYCTENVTWTSTDKTVAEIENMAGVVRAVSSGKCKIIGITESGKTLVINLGVSIDATKIELLDTSYDKLTTLQYYDIGRTKTIYVDITPYNADGVIKYVSTNESVIKISAIFEEGCKIETTGYGFAEVYAYIETSTGTIKSDKIKITVKQKESPALSKIKSKQVISSSKSSYSVKYLISPFSLKAKTSGDGKLSYTSSNTNVAKVSKCGIVTIVGFGNAKITVVASETVQYEKSSKVINVNVKKATQSITVSDISTNSDARPFKLNIKRTGNGKLTYTSSDTSVVKVSKNGKITIGKSGIATIRIVANGTMNYQKTVKVIKVTVKPKKVTVKSIKRINQKKIQLALNKEKGIDGYQIVYSKNSKYKKSTTKNISVKQSKITIKKTKNTKYYMKIRAYKFSKGKKIYGGWKKLIIEK